MKNCSALVALLLLCGSLFAGNKVPNRAHTSKTPVQRTIFVRCYIHHISDINIRDQEYKIEIWLYLSTKDTIWAWDSLASQFQVDGAKEMSVTVVPQYHAPGTLRVYDSTTGDSVYRQIIKLNCTMAQDWDVDNFPFDQQNLKIVCYTVRPMEWVILIPVESKISYGNSSDDLGRNLENGWFIVGDSVKVAQTCQGDIFDAVKKYSAIQFSMKISRQQIPALFFKLFIGMYVSFFVAFIAMFIKVTNAEPRFGLPVGGLFAAIGNKYIMEGILPQAPEFTIVDTLHTFTIVAILLMILFSAVSLKLVPRHSAEDLGSSARFPLSRKQMNWIDKHGSKFILIGYVTLNVICILWAIMEERVKLIWQA